MTIGIDGAILLRALLRPQIGLIPDVAKRSSFGLLLLQCQGLDTPAMGPWWQVVLIALNRWWTLLIG